MRQRESTVAMVLSTLCCIRCPFEPFAGCTIPIVGTLVPQAWEMLAHYNRAEKGQIEAAGIVPFSDRKSPVAPVHALLIRWIRSTLVGWVLCASSPPALLERRRRPQGRAPGETPPRGERDVVVAAAAAAVGDTAAKHSAVGP
jgi:hypothetical protein